MDITREQGPGGFVESGPEKERPLEASNRSVELPPTETPSPVGGVSKEGAREAAERAEAARLAQDPLLGDIETALSSGLGSFYTSLTPDEQASFKNKGEELAKHLRADIARVEPRKIVAEVRSWLTGAKCNKFFAEQHAKIVVDDILAAQARASHLR